MSEIKMISIPVWKFDKLESENARLREALEKILKMPLYGSTCSCPEDCSCGEKEAREIAGQALSATEGEK